MRPEDTGREISQRPGNLPDPWTALRSLTSARIALGRAGSSLPTRAVLEFQLAHAAARDAVRAEFNPEDLKSQISKLKSEIGDWNGECVVVHSAAADAQSFLLRPDLGRRLDDQSPQVLIAIAGAQTDLAAGSRGRSAEARSDEARPDLVIVISDGLSALAVHRQAVPLLRELLALLPGPPGGAATTDPIHASTPRIGRANDSQWNLAPIVIACRGRVAIEDEIGEILGARMALILIGERPGLGSPDGLGAYLVYGPRVGNTDAHRNCVSNIRPEGLGYVEAARTIHYLLTQARGHRLSGVGLKDNSGLLAQASDGGGSIPPV